MMQVVQEGGRILYLKAKNTVELMEWYGNSCYKVILEYVFLASMQAFYLIKGNSLY